MRLGARHELPNPSLLPTSGGEEKLLSRGRGLDERQRFSHLRYTSSGVVRILNAGADAAVVRGLNNTIGFAVAVYAPEQPGPAGD